MFETKYKVKYMYTREYGWGYYTLIKRWYHRRWHLSTFSSTYGEVAKKANEIKCL